MALCGCKCCAKLCFTCGSILWLACLACVAWRGRLEIPLLHDHAMKKLAFAFLLEDRFNFEDVWTQYFAGLPEESYLVVLHFSDDGAKNDARGRPAFKHLVAEHRGSDWCELLSPIHSLVQSSLNDPEVFGLIFVSDSSIPIKSASYTHSYLLELPKSTWNFIDGFTQKHSLWGYMRRADMLRVSWEPRMRIWLSGSDQTFGLPSYLTVFFPYPDDYETLAGCPDEYFMSKIVGDVNLARGMLTAECWAEKPSVSIPDVPGFCDAAFRDSLVAGFEPDSQEGWHPIAFDTLSPSALDALWELPGVVFARKVHGTTTSGDRLLSDRLIELLGG